MTLRQPDDWHVHFRDDEMLCDTVPATARHFGRALVMPNLNPPLTTLDSLLAYRERILKAAVNFPHFTPYMTFYLNEQVTLDELEQALQQPFILGAKLYPRGVTTHSQAGAESIRALYPALELMQNKGLTLQIHGETPTGDIFAREAHFIEQELRPLQRDFPKLNMVLEHISTREAVEFIKETPEHVAATITPHHILFNRNQLLANGIKPHYYCLPILKHTRHQRALLAAATSGNPKFFAGTDSAPHPQHQKESACGCAGIFSAPFAVALYARAFASADRIERLDAFLSEFGANFYQLPLATRIIELINQSEKIPASLKLGHARVIPLAAGESLEWSIHEPN